jgi:hypothetical protein
VTSPGLLELIMIDGRRYARWRRARQARASR